MGGRDGSSGRPVPPSPSLCREAEPGDLRECPLGRVGFTVGFAGYGGGRKGPRKVWFESPQAFCSVLTLLLKGRGGQASVGLLCVLPRASQVEAGRPATYCGILI